MTVIAKEKIVLYSMNELGHLCPTVELAKLLLKHGCSVSVVILQVPFASIPQTESYISRVSSSFPSLSFHLLTRAISSPDSMPTNPAAAFFHFVSLSNPLLRDYLTASEAPIRALIIEHFCGSAVDVATELGIPFYFFAPNSASFLAAFLHLPALHSTYASSFKDLGDEPISFPGLARPIPASDFPNPIMDREDDAYKHVIEQFQRVPDAKGMLVNTFEALEPQVLRNFADGVCAPEINMPPVYIVGPVIKANEDEPEACEIMAWLDGQPSCSVVYLSFGSMGSLSEAQVREIATGLEQSEQKFLWVVRSPPSGELKGEPVGWKEPDFNELLPEGFLERTRGRGFVVRSWAPQRTVLRHTAVGGFVTHCGWNSALESIEAGVAMIAWPLYAEQRMNKLFLVEEAGLAVEMRGHKEGFVGAAEVAEKARWIIESEGGKELRARVAKMAESARAALRKGGSSHSAITKFTEILRNEGLN